MVIFDFGLDFVGPGRMLIFCDEHGEYTYCIPLYQHRTPTLEGKKNPIAEAIWGKWLVYNPLIC